MKKRSFIPAISARLESRAMLSAAAEVARGPVSVSGIGLDGSLARIKADFEEYATAGATPKEFKRLQNNLNLVVPGFPFAKADGLSPTVGAILRQMRQQVAAGSTHAIQDAYQQVVGTIKASVQAHIADGSIVVR